MAAETAQWEALDRHQAHLMIGRVVAASECVFGKAAQQAGIGVLNGTRMTVTMENEPYDAVAWPDSTLPNTTCFITSNENQNYHQPLGFARVTELQREQSYAIEGVVLNVLGDASVQLYGSERRPYASMGNDTSAAAAGLTFINQAAQHARNQDRNLRYISSRQAAATLGVRGEKIGSLVSSMVTLESNLVFGLTMNEQGKVTGRTYDQAQAMLKKMISDSTSGKPSGGTVLPGAGGVPAGVLFASDHEGLMVLRRINTYPQTIAFTVACPPERDLGSAVEQYFIQPRGVYTNVSVLRDEDYSGQGLLNIIPSLDGALKEDPSRRIHLDDEGLDALDLKMVKVLSGRTFQPAR
jgi:hypothetical protein